MQRTRRSRLLLAAFSAFAVTSAVAFAADSGDALEESAGSSLRLSVIDHLLMSNATDPNNPQSNPTSLLMHEDSVRAEYDPYSLNVHFTNRYTPDGPPIQNAPFNFEKITAGADWQDWSLAAGDSHQELGRGIALSLYQDKIFGIDNTVQGAAVRFHPAGFDTNVFAGRVNQIIVPVAINPMPPLIGNSSMYLAAGSSRLSLNSDTKIGAQYMFAESPPMTPTDSDKQWQTVGGMFSMDNIVPDVDMYLESNMMTTQALGSLAQTYPNSFGSYGSLVWSPAPWQVKFETKDYRYPMDAPAFALRRPPTLEEDVVDAPNITNVTASRLYVEHRDQETKMTVYGSMLGGWDRLANTQVYHGVLGAKFVGPSRTEFEVKGGYRDMPNWETLYHAGAKAKFHTFKGQAFEVGIRKRWDLNSALTLSGVPDDRNMLDLGYTFNERLNVALGFEYLPTDTGNGRDFVNVGVNYKIGNLASRAFIGKTSGGVLCSGGVCRVVPPYTGGLIETTYTF